MSLVFDEQDSAFQQQQRFMPSFQKQESSLSLFVKRVTGISDDAKLTKVLLGIAAGCIILSALAYKFLAITPEGDGTLPAVYKEDVTPELEHLFTPEQLLDLPRKNQP